MRTGRGAAALALAVLLAPGLAQARDYMDEAKKALARGDVRAAQIELRNLVRDNPDNANAHFSLAQVDLNLGEFAQAEKEAQLARDKGFDPHQVIPVLAQSYLAQRRFNDVLTDFTVQGKDAVLDSEVQVVRGFALIGLNKPDEAQAAFADAEKLAPNAEAPLLAQARLAQARGDLDAADAKLDQVLKVNPHSADALLRKGAIKRARGDLDGAYTLIDEALTQSPGSSPIRMERASVNIARNKDADAKSDIDIVLKAFPNNAQAIYLTALLQARARDFKAADASLQRINPQIANIAGGYYLLAVVKQNLGDVEQAADAASRFAARNPDNINAQKLLAAIKLDQRQPDQVIGALSKIAADGRADGQVWDLLGRAYALSNQPDKAVEAFDKAAALAPGDPTLQRRLAAVEMGRGDPDAAVSSLEKSLEIAPKQDAVGPALFFAELATGDMGRASAAVDKIRAIQGETPIVRNLEGLLKLAQLDMPGARGIFSKLAADDPDFTAAKVNLARTYVMEGNADAAMQTLGGVLAKDPNSEPALTIYVQLALQGGKNDEAVKAVVAAHEGAPANERLTASLADLYVRTGAPKKALDLLGQVNDTAKSSPVLLAARGRAQAASGDTAGALATYRQVLALAPTANDIRQTVIAMLIRDKDYAGARVALQEGMQANPNNYDYLRDMVALDLMAGGIDLALATADRLDRANLTFPAARALRGDALVGAQRYDEAAAAYGKAMQTSPSSFLVLRQATALVSAGKQDQAIALLNDYLLKHPEDLVATSGLASMEITAGLYDQAETHLNAVLAKNPRQGDALNNLAWLYQKRGDPRAEATAQRAYLLAPGPESADTLGWILTSGGAPARGEVLLRIAGSQQPADPRIQYHLAVALNDTGKKADAVKVLQGVVAAKGDFDEKTQAQKLLTELGG